MLSSLALGLLCGGKSSRFGSNKALADIDGAPLIQAVAEQLKSLKLPLWLLSHTPEPYPFLQLPYLLDATPGAGPLAALSSAFEQTSYEYFLLVACDMPKLDLQLLQELILQKKKAPALVPKDSQGPQFLSALYSRSLLNPLTQFVRQGGRSFKKFFELYPDSVAFIETGTKLYNVNTKQEFEEYLYAR